MVCLLKKIEYFKGGMTKLKLKIGGVKMIDTEANKRWDKGNMRASI